MKKRKIATVGTIFFASLIGFAHLSMAQSDSPASKEPKRTVYDFDAIDILGEVKKPVGESIVKAPEFRFKKLLNLDESFLPNISKAVDEY